MATMTTYRAACGDTVKSVSFRTKRLPEVAMGWLGDQRCQNPSLRTDQHPPERCRNCRSLRKSHLSFFDEEHKEFFGVEVWVCTSFSRVDEDREAVATTTGETQNAPA